jgi:phosphoglycerol transferase MdoB-like AlkP superfamily enzyme
MESLALYKTGIGGSMVNPTPYLDQLAKESMFFKNFYTPTVATARSVFAAITSLPDVSKVKTGSRNPFIVNQHTNIADLVDHEKYYFLGGSANWGNIRGVLSHNIPDLKIYEEGSYSSPRVDVWGISDLDLFKEAHNVLKENSSEKPFFAIIQSAGFHRPYTIPENSDQFKVLSESEVDMKKIKEYGFESLAEYNAMRLQDYSLGRFFELAKKEKYYKNTIFMVFGDHGLPHNNAPNVPDWARGQAHGYHVPFLIYSPKYIQPSVDERIASEMDVMPSVASIVGVPFKTRSLGRDLFNPENDSYRAAFSYNWYAPFHISLIDKDYYFEMIPSNDEGTLKKWSHENPNQEMKEIDKEKYQEMKRLTKGLYETSKFLLHHNQKIK